MQILLNLLIAQKPSRILSYKLVASLPHALLASLSQPSEQILDKLSLETYSRDANAITTSHRQTRLTSCSTELIPKPRGVYSLNPRQVNKPSEVQRPKTIYGKSKSILVRAQSSLYIKLIIPFGIII